MIASADTWAAISALATLATALITLLLGFLYTKRQTRYAYESAANAKVSADAAMAATRLAEKNLALVAAQLSSQDRPAFKPDSMGYAADIGEYAFEFVNVGRGPGWVNEAVMVVGPLETSMRDAMRRVIATRHVVESLFISPQVVGVNDRVRLMSRDDASDPIAGTYWVVFQAHDFAASEPWTYFFAYVIEDVADFNEQERLTASGFFACRGMRVVSEDEISWPLAELEKQARSGGLELEARLATRRDGRRGSATW